MCSLRHLGKNPHAARARIEAGAAKGIRYGLWKLGNLQVEAGEFRQALDYYKACAEEGLALGARAAAWMYAGSMGCDPDLALSNLYYQIAADAGCGRAALEVGIGHIYGRGVESDIDQGMAFLKKAVDAGVSKAKSYLAYIDATGAVPLESQGQSILKLVGLAREGDVASSYALGVWWAEGMPGWVDLERAVSAYRWAAEHGCIRSKVELAGLMIAGKGMERDSNGAARLLSEAIEAGDVEAMADLGTILLRGTKELSPDVGQAIRWLGRAVDAGNTNAKAVLGRHLAESSERADHERAKLLLESAVQAGSVASAHSLTYLIEKVPNLWSQPKQHDRLIACAEMGVTDAMMMLAKEEPDRDVRLFWLECAHQDGDVFPSFALGSELWEQNTKAETAEAIACWKFASKSGSAEATRVLADLYYTGSRVKRDLRKAAHYLDLLADNGDLEAKALLDQLRVRGVRLSDEQPPATVLPILRTKEMQRA